LINFRWCQSLMIRMGKTVTAPGLNFRRGGLHEVIETSLLDGEIVV